MSRSFSDHYVKSILSHIAALCKPLHFILNRDKFHSYLDLYADTPLWEMLIFYLHGKVCLQFSPYCLANDHKRRKSSHQKEKFGCKRGTEEHFQADCPGAPLE